MIFTLLHGDQNKPFMLELATTKNSNVFFNCYHNKGKKNLYAKETVELTTGTIAKRRDMRYPHKAKGLHFYNNQYKSIF